MSINLLLGDMAYLTRHPWVMAMNYIDMLEAGELDITGDINIDSREIPYADWRVISLDMEVMGIIATKYIDAECNLPTDLSKIASQYSVSYTKQDIIDSIYRKYPECVDEKKERAERKQRRIGMWENLSLNPAAIDLLRQNTERIDWSALSRNPIDLLMEHHGETSVEQNGERDRETAVELDVETVVIEQKTESIVELDYNALFERFDRQVDNIRNKPKISRKEMAKKNHGNINLQIKRERQMNRKAVRYFRGIVQKFGRE
jgi:hypothetical protein